MTTNCRTTGDTLSRILALVAAHLNVSLSPCGDTPFSVHITDIARGCHLVAIAYAWRHGGSVDATLEAAVSAAERYVARRDVDEQRALAAIVEDAAL